jgi:hypothetical protein
MASESEAFSWGLIVAVVPAAFCSSLEAEQKSSAL